MPSLFEQFRTRIQDRNTGKYELNSLSKDQRILYEITESLNNTKSGGVFGRSEIKSSSPAGFTVENCPATDCCYNRINLNDKKQKFLLHTGTGTFRFVGLNWISDIPVEIEWKPKELKLSFHVGTYHIGRYRWDLARLEFELLGLVEGSSITSPSGQIDERRRVLAEIIARQGQEGFRRSLLEAYSVTCAVTGCDVPDALEAAHIEPYMGPKSNVLTNGILLRADIHTLYDLGLIAIQPSDYRIHLSDGLKTSSYSDLDGKVIALPSRQEQWPGPDNLARVWERFSSNQFGISQSTIRKDEK